MKYLPSACSTATRASGVASTQSKAWRISCHMAAFMALAFSGRFRRTVAMWFLQRDGKGLKRAWQFLLVFLASGA